jgi:hypothetical protein
MGCAQDPRGHPPPLARIASPLAVPSGAGRPIVLWYVGPRRVGVRPRSGTAPPCPGCRPQPVIGSGVGYGAQDPRRSSHQGPRWHVSRTLFPSGYATCLPSLPPSELAPRAILEEVQPPQYGHFQVRDAELPLDRGGAKAEAGEGKDGPKSIVGEVFDVPPECPREACAEGAQDPAPKVADNGGRETKHEVQGDRWLTVVGCLSREPVGPSALDFAGRRGLRTGSVLWQGPNHGQTRSGPGRGPDGRPRPE